MTENPRLRPLDFQPVTHMGQQMWYLRDPLQLTAYQLVMPPALAQLLIFCDGTRTAAQIHADFCRHVGQDVDYDIVADALAQLDTACLLDNWRSREAQEGLLAEFRAQPHRPPALADLSYPADPQALTALFSQYGAADDAADWQPWQGLSLIHISEPTRPY